MPRVMLIPETEDFEMDVSHGNVVWVTKKLGVPRRITPQTAKIVRWPKEAS